MMTEISTNIPIPSNYRDIFHLTSLDRIAQLCGDTQQFLPYSSNDYELCKDIQSSIQLYNANELIHQQQIGLHPNLYNKTKSNESIQNSIYHTSKFIAALKYRTKQKQLYKQKLIEYAIHTKQCVLLQPLNDIHRLTTHTSHSIGLTLDNKTMLYIINKKYHELQRHAIVDPNTLKHIHQFSGTAVCRAPAANNNGSQQLKHMISNALHDNNITVGKLSHVSQNYTSQSILQSNRHHQLIMNKLRTANLAPLTTPRYTQQDRHTYNVSLDPPKPAKIPVNSVSKQQIQQRIQLKQYLLKQAEDMKAMNESIK